MADGIVSKCRKRMDDCKENDLLFSHFLCSAETYLARDLPKLLFWEQVEGHFVVNGIEDLIVLVLIGKEIQALFGFEVLLIICSISDSLVVGLELVSLLRINADSCWSSSWNWCLLLNESTAPHYIHARVQDSSHSDPVGVFDAFHTVWIFFDNAWHVLFLGLFDEFELLG